MDPHEEALRRIRDRARAKMLGDEEDRAEHSEPDGDEGARITIIIGGEPDGSRSGGHVCEGCGASGAVLDENGLCPMCAGDENDDDMMTY